MKKLLLIFILCAIIAFSTALYFIIDHFSPSADVTEQTPTVSISPTQTQTVSQTQTSPCQQNQLSLMTSSQGAAGNIYANVEITNVGNKACDIVLGDTLTLAFYGQNITKHYQQDVSTEHFTLAPTQKVYSQIHYPDGPQCQSGIVQKKTYFLYFIPQSSSEIDFTNQTITIPICNSDSENTTIDIWPLSKTPITP